MRKAATVGVAVALAAWTVVGGIEVMSVASRSCAEAASEITDPCSGKAAYLLFYGLVWLALGLPLAYAFAALRRRRV